MFALFGLSSMSMIIFVPCFSNHRLYLPASIVKLIKIHSPMRADPNRVVKWVPSHHMIRAARIASEKFLR